MNQKSQQNSNNSFEKDFSKLLNNVNFGYGCHDNFDNCIFELICDEIAETPYINNYFDLFEKSICNCLNIDFIK